jgi:Protein of unknown function (DUF3352)
MILKLAMSSAFSLILILVLAVPAATQTRRQTPARPQPAPPTKTAPTFDTLLAADTYKIYGEVRSVGQLIRSNSINEILEPIMKLSSPPKEFRTLVKWLNTHADEVMTSRLLLAGWPNGGELPDLLVAIEFASPEEASKFKERLNTFLPKLLPAPSPQSSPSPETSPQPLPYHLQQAGSLILVTPTPFNIEKLRPAGSKLLSEDVNFRVARNRFNSESIFIYVDVARIEKEEQEQRKRFEEQRKQAIAAAAQNVEELERAKAEMEKIIQESETQAPPPVEDHSTETEIVLEAKPPDSTTGQMSKADQLNYAMMIVGFVSQAYTEQQGKWPEAIGVAVSLEGDSFDVRALLVNAPGEKSDPLPFLPLLSPGPALVPESPNILPADTEMIITMSLDLGRIYAAVSKPLPPVTATPPGMMPVQIGPVETPFERLEKQLKIKFKDDLVPLLGPEVVISVPLTGFDLLQPPKARVQSPSSPSPSPSPSPNKETQEPAKPTRGPAILLSVKDKEGVRALLPKIIEAAAFKGASAFASTERREDTELVSYANLMAYAFIGNFLVISTDPATTRHIVDSYLKHQTLAGDPQFKNYTRWQPRMIQAQVYVSPALMETYRAWVQQPNQPLDDQLRQMLTRLTIMPQPVTYSLSNEGFGPLHELHLPKNLVLMFVASIAGAPSPVISDKPSN